MGKGGWVGSWLSVGFSVCLFVKEVLRILASGEYHQLQWEIQTFQAWGSLAAESFFTMPLDGDCSPKHMSWGLPA